MSYASTVLADNPIRYYRLNETSGTVVTDYGSQSQNGTLNGTVTLNQAKLAIGLDPCMKFDGSTGYVLLPTASLPTGSAVFSIECWISTLSFPASGFQCATVMGNSGTDAWGALFVKNSTAQGIFGFGNDDLAAGALSISTTYHFVGVWDGTKQNLYINGTNFNRVPGIPNLTESFAYIAKDVFGDFFNGYVSEVAIYNTALNSTQVNNHYNAGNTASATHLRIMDGYGGVFS